MRFKGLNSDKEINISIADYLIDWERTVSGPQKAVKDFLRPFWKGKVILEEFHLPKTRYRFDLVNMTDRVIVEVSPQKVHGSFNKFFHKTRQGYANSIKRDLLKQEWAEHNGFVLVEIYDNDIKQLSREWFREKYGVEL